MKKLTNLALSLVLVFALAGCGKEQTATYSITQTSDGMTLTDTQTYSAKGDLVYEMKENTVVDFSEYDETAKSVAMELTASTYEEMCATPPAGVTISCETSGDIITLDMTIDLKTADLKELVDKGYIYTTADENGNLRAISFTQTCSGLESSGYTAQE